MMIIARQSYDREFKQKALELSFARGNAKEIAEELGIRPELLYQWRREYQQYDKNSFPGKGNCWDNAVAERIIRVVANYKSPNTIVS